MNKKEMKYLTGRLGKLLKSNRCRLACAAINFPEADGVYVISKPSSKEGCLYVGMTGKGNSGGLRHRAYLHLHNNTKSDYRKKCKNKINETAREKTKRLGRHEIRCLEVRGKWLRTRLEYFAIAVLNPPLNRR